MRSVELEAIPAIGPVPAGVERPTWSVMVPSYNAGPLLEETLRAVLDQDPGADRMQVAVVDDCSPDGEAERIVRRLAPGRVEFHRQPANVGLAGNWNGCIARARGYWVHLLHQDDLVFPGFYERLGLASRERPDAGAAFCRHIHTDGDGHWEVLSPVERREAGILDGWLSKISQMQRIQCASIAVRRCVYEQLGGFRSDLYYALDWEMWVRIAARYPIWYEPRPLACWRIHDGNESARLRRDGAEIPDVLRAIEIVRDHLPAESRGTAGGGLLEHFRDMAMAEAYRFMIAGDWRSGMARVRQACEWDPSLKRGRTLLQYRKWEFKLRLSQFVSGARSAASGAE